MVSVSFLRKGFSHLELMIFVLIMVIMIMFSAGAFQKYRQHTILASYAKNLESDLNYYRSKAIADNVDIELIFFAKYYRLIEEGQKIEDHDYPENISIDYVKVGFKPSGSAKYAGSIIIKYRDRAAQKITVSPASGLITRKKI